MTALIVESEGFEDSGVSLMDYILGPAGTAITQASISSIAYSVFVKGATDADSAYAASSSGTLTVSAVVFDTLQTDARWTRDDVGYNFRWDVAASLVPEGEKIYKFEIKFTPASGEAFHAVHKHSTVGLERS